MNLRCEMNQIVAAIIAAASEGDREYAAKLVPLYNDVLDMIYNEHRARTSDDASKHRRA